MYVFLCFEVRHLSCFEEEFRTRLSTISFITLKHDLPIIKVYFRTFHADLELSYHKSWMV